MSGLEQDAQEIDGEEECGAERGDRSGGGLRAAGSTFGSGIPTDWDEVRGEPVGESIALTSFLGLEPKGTMPEAGAVVPSRGGFE